MKELKDNIDKLHTTILGEERIKRNLMITQNSVSFCKKLIRDNNCIITRKGKNYYCSLDDIAVTVNAYSYTIITAHKK